MEDHSGSVIMEEIIRRNQMLTHLDNVGFAELILTGGWYLWWERRPKVHGEEVQGFARSAMSIMVLTLNYKNATKKEVQVKEGWKKPAENYVKLNVDASFSEATGTGATGAIIRDHTGQAIALAQRFLQRWRCTNGRGICSAGWSSVSRASGMQSDNRKHRLYAGGFDHA